MRNYQIYPYFLRDGVVLHDTGVGTVPNKQNFASTAKRWLVVFLDHLLIPYFPFLSIFLYVLKEQEFLHWQDVIR